MILWNQLSYLNISAFPATMRKMWVQFAKAGNPVLSVDIAPDGKAKERPVYDPENKQVLFLDEFNIYEEKESERNVLDWDRICFLSRYYCI